MARSMMGSLTEILDRLTRLERTLTQVRRSRRGPVGTLGWTAAPTAPRGALLLNGQAVSRAAYPRLFSEIGTTYGAGNGTTTFNVPDLRGRTLAHLGRGSFTTLGDVTGAESVALTVAQMPEHRHGPGTLTTFMAYQGGATVARRQVTGSSAGNHAFTASNIDNLAGTTVTSYEGGGGAHNNIQPTMAMNAYIWT